MYLQKRSLILNEALPETPVFNRIRLSLKEFGAILDGFARSSVSGKLRAAPGRKLVPLHSSKSFSQI